MSRISRPQMFMDICDIVAKRSTCGRQNVGAVLINYQHTIVSHGYNGPPSKDMHCKGVDCELTKSGGCLRSIHAEVNALLRCPVIGELDLYVSLSPCMDCAKIIVDDRRVKRIFYRQEYRIRDSIEWLADAGIEIYRLTPAGHLINGKTNELILGALET